MQNALSLKCAKALILLRWQQSIVELQVKNLMRLQRGRSHHQLQQHQHNQHRCLSSSVMDPHAATASATSYQETATSASRRDELPASVADLVNKYASMNQTASSLQMLIRMGQGELLGNGFRPSDSVFMGRLGRQLASERVLIQVASLLRQELPIRLAYRIKDLDQIPFMRDMEAVQNVKNIYIDSFLKLIDVPQIVTPQDEMKFAHDLQDLYKKHSGVMVQMAQGAYQLKAAVRNRKDSELAIDDIMDLCQDFLDRFYTSRIGIRVLAGQYLALHDQHQDSLYGNSTNKDLVGMIHLKTNPTEIVRDAADHATFMCTRQYGNAPGVKIEGRLDRTFPYIPTYLHYVVLELLKNAMRATAEEHANMATFPPLTVVIADGKDNEDVVIKIMDEGGGIRRSQINTKIWSYLFTTADQAIQDAFLAGNTDHDDNAPIAGLGYGLPIARSYCRYFGGDLQLMSMEGYGTDAFVHLKRMGDSKEPLPL
ncbi:hypothetical protein ACA910_017197 [Epithemia clementina (nom. ined.)]